MTARRLATLDDVWDDMRHVVLSGEPSDAGFARLLELLRIAAKIKHGTDVTLYELDGRI